MENSKEKNKSNVVVIVLLSIIILLLLVAITLLFFQPNINNSNVSNGTDSKIEDHTSNKVSNVSPNENNLTNVSDNNSTSDDENDENILRTTKTINLNGNDCKVDVSCKLDLDEVYENGSIYTTNYTVTINGKKCKGILGSKITDLYDNPKPEDLFAISKIADKNTNKEYLVFQVISPVSTPTFFDAADIDAYIINDDLSILETIRHDGHTIFIIDNEAKELTVKSDYISDYTWHPDRNSTTWSPEDNLPNVNDVVLHVYTVENGKLVDTIEKTFKEGEYEVAGRS